MNRKAFGGVLLHGTNMNAWVGEFADAVLIADRTLEREFEERLADSSTLAFRVALGVLRNREDAEDVAQEALVRAYRNFVRLRDRERFRGWLARIAWRLALDRRRSDIRRERRELAAVEPEAVANADDLVAAREFGQHLETALDKLPERLRMAFVFAVIEGYDMRETAALLGTNEGTVRSRVHAVRRRLAEELRWLVGGTETR